MLSSLIVSIHLQIGRVKRLRRSDRGGDDRASGRGESDAQTIDDDFGAAASAG
jgi:hypothetical protein